MRLLHLLDKQKASAAAITHLPNVRYLSGFTGSNAILLISGRGATLYTDPRYDIQAHQEVQCSVRIVRGPLWPEVAREIAKRRLPTVALEADKIPHANWLEVAKLLGKGVKLRPMQGVVESLRSVKSPGEIATIRQSVQVNSKALAQTLKRVKPGMTELAVAADLDYRMRGLGAEAAAFETIVASGVRSALPHARPTAEKLKNDQVLLIDMGASLDGYASDMTRVVHLGKPGARIRGLYEAVLEAQLQAIAAVKPGASCADVDEAARGALRKRKLDRYFTHSTGHGLGLEIHEIPRIGAKVETVLQPGMVITIEPGVYVEDFGGVRIEDTVLVTETGVEVLTPTTKEFVVLAS
ncbi:Xaa-Pro peptidase family protein [uncultured Paludibaculum sp.]|uniref:M24 family metallopeptidase n=1 Tax=uncultured Paludibaculum sp. TaxID=1765020 RepID=UPI002AAB5E8C|nr:Xaa-Pro peptidase family protein [uncultured Paludibaculum sp.]